jgi:hypothetical protein
MNLITDTWHGLVQRKLWPVALLLVAALVAVPLVLAKEPEPLPPMASAAQASKDQGLPVTYVSEVGEDGEAVVRRRVLGVAKDPFEPKALPKKKKAKAKAKAKATATPTAEPDSSAAGGGTPDAGSGTTPPVSPGPTATPTVTIPAFSIKVRFGRTDGELGTGTFERLSVLPDDENPVLVYRGVEDGGKVAIFELTGAVVADGDGTCAPTPQDCQYLKLRAGETEFITVTDTGTEADAQYQLDLVKITTKATKAALDPDAEAEVEPLAKGSSANLKGVTLRKRNRYVFDDTTGTLRRARGKTPADSL